MGSTQSNIAKQALINQPIYPVDLHNKLLKACESIYISTDHIIKEKKEKNQTLVVFKDDTYNFQWVLDLTNFNHPFGIGPNNTSLKNRRAKYLDITDEFNRQSHNCENYIMLLHYVVGLYCPPE